MRPIILTCCGETTPSAHEAATCPSCGASFTEMQLEQLQGEQVSRLPVVDLRAASAMLGRPPESIRAEWDLLEPIYGVLGLDFVFPITAIRRYASERNLAPSRAPRVLLIDRPAHQ